MRRLLLFVMGVLLLCTNSYAQNRTITGRITDPNGIAIPGATVTVTGTTTTVVANSNGNFTIVVPVDARSLTISSVGYASQVVPLGTSNEVTVTLSTTSQELTTVVVTGYQRVRRSEYSGSATKVTAEKINLVPAASFDQILQGRAPGLLVTSGSGQPGTAARVQIRGAASITGGNAPLYVVDGMPVEAGVFQSINPNDFESVDVLRDALATAQYGNRGANGVIVATTKRGKAGKPVVTYSGQAGITQVGTQRFEMMNSAELLKYHEVLGSFTPGITLPGWLYSRQNPANAGLPAATLAEYDAILDSLRGINTNWADIFQRDGNFQSHDLNVSGGNGGTTYFLSGGYYKEEGIGLRSDLERYTVRANIDNRTDKLVFGFRGSAGYTKRNFIESENSVTLANPFAAAYLALPYHTVFNPDGSYAVGSGKVGPNAYARVFETSSSNDQIKLNGSMNATYNITNSISVGGFAGIDYRNTVGERSIFPNTFAANNAAFPVGPGNGFPTGGGSYGNTYSRFLQTIVRANAGYHRVFADRHDVDFQLISEYTREKVNAFNYTGYGLNDKLLNTPAAITPGTQSNLLIPAVGGSKTGRSLYGLMALAKYTFDGKYTFNGSIRRDASSQLPEDNRWVTFAAGGVTWAVLKENFASNWNFVNELNVRASYGTTANADGFPFGDFGYLPLFGPSSYNGVSNIGLANLGNMGLTWEKIATLNLGVDFAFFRNRLSGSLDLYNKKGIENIVTQEISSWTGGEQLDVNAATVRNRGVEFQLSADVIRTKDFVWTVGGNVAYNDNEVVDLGQVNEFEQGTEIVREGLPLGSHYIVKWAGVDAATGAPLYYKKDGTITTQYSDDDRVAEFGTYNAPWIGGYNTTLKYKGFQLDALFTWQSGFSRFNNQDFFQLNHAFAVQGFNMKKEMVTMWQKPGDVTDIQSPLYQRQFVSKDIQDASFTRLRNVTLSYNFPSRIVGATRVLSGARIFVQGQNLYTWTEWTGFDPEDNNNIAQYEYPTPRTFTLGLTMNFK